MRISGGVSPWAATLVYRWRNWYLASFRSLLVIAGVLRSPWSICLDLSLRSSMNLVLYRVETRLWAGIKSPMKKVVFARMFVRLYKTVKEILK